MHHSANRLYPKPEAKPAIFRIRISIVFTPNHSYLKTETCESIKLLLHIIPNNSKHITTPNYTSIQQFSTINHRIQNWHHYPQLPKQNQEIYSSLPTYNPSCSQLDNKNPTLTWFWIEWSSTLGIESSNFLPLGSVSRIFFFCPTNLKTKPNFLFLFCFY